MLERRAGIEPANAGFADLSVSHFATGALKQKDHTLIIDDAETLCEHLQHGTRLQNWPL